MTHQFDERGEAAIANLRKDKRFNEALYRELGPVRYWTQVRHAEELIANRDTPRQGHDLSVRSHETPASAYVRGAREQYEKNRARHRADREQEVKMISRTDDIPVESNKRGHSKAVNIATAITLVGGALVGVSIVLTCTAIICLKLWIWMV
jgi:hypothetical protein